MAFYPNKNEPEITKIKIRDDAIKISKNQTEKHDREKILESLEVDTDYYRKNIKH